MSIGPWRNCWSETHVPPPQDGLPSVQPAGPPSRGPAGKGVPGGSWPRPGPGRENDVGEGEGEEVDERLPKHRPVLRVHHVAERPLAAQHRHPPGARTGLGGGGGLTPPPPIGLPAFPFVSRGGGGDWRGGPADDRAMATACFVQLEVPTNLGLQSSRTFPIVPTSTPYPSECTCSTVPTGEMCKP